ncbi:uncharacterized protein C8Q71DRAFT_845685 [Rhodofomes roseus]|uniref:Uncharacterized protein n=1 Tax=Rhodofomes roseus TaxID=34475 RepID=A0ABQ8KRX9_9APHY|nr:uncharacterized protein C8Q71DRAFT_845685 [Rhodofomes roseus]KAH9841563.1 hypothetical protein C8Q71DRAFT_845685 [Rhodofomes roseus]
MSSCLCTAHHTKEPNDQPFSSSKDTVAIDETNAYWQVLFHVEKLDIPALAHVSLPMPTASPAYWFTCTPLPPELVRKLRLSPSSHRGQIVGPGPGCRGDYDGTPELADDCRRSRCDPTIHESCARVRLMSVDHAEMHEVTGMWEGNRLYLRIQQRSTLCDATRSLEPIIDARGALHAVSLAQMAFCCAPYLVLFQLSWILTDRRRLDIQAWLLFHMARTRFFQSVHMHSVTPGSQIKPGKAWLQ